LGGRSRSRSGSFRSGRTPIITEEKGDQVKRHVAVLLGLSFAASSAIGQTQTAATPSANKPAASAGAQTPLQKNVESYLRHLYALGPNVQLTVSAPKESEIPGLLETIVDLKDGENSQAAKFYLSRDGKYLVRGEVSDLSKDPMAETRALLQMKDAPSLGDPKAPVTLVEFSDFECPVCRSLHDVLRGMLPNYPQVRVVFKDFPLESLHPWARTAALAGRCAYQQNASAFWKVYDLIYDQQELISASNAWTKMSDFAGQAGLNADAFRVCMASPEAGAAIEASKANGQRLEVGSTPTVFVNGRRVVGADARVLEQYIQYELAQLKSAKSTDK
jgi:protein-disulfide isomerase